jgi:hypothetical protein
MKISVMTALFENAPPPHRPAKGHAAIFGRQVIVSLLLAGACHSGQAPAAAAAEGEKLAALVAAYPDFLDHMDGNDLVWKDGTRMPIDDGKPPKTLDMMLQQPNLKDMFIMTYPAGENGPPPPLDFDPGRVRYEPLFKRMYGDCKTDPDFMSNAVDVVWLPTRYGKRLKFTGINNAAAALQSVSVELDKLPASFAEFLIPPAGTYNCRPIAGTDRISPHGFGIAVDIATAKADYWLWSNPVTSGQLRYRNRIPWQVVEIFEHHGFIWGGKWYHYDTMHFEYRPEIIATAK